LQGICLGQRNPVRWVNIASALAGLIPVLLLSRTITASSDSAGAA